MNCPNWDGASFIALISRLRAMGVAAELPKPSQSPSSYVAQLAGYLLEAQGKMVDPAFVDPMFVKGAPAIETAKKHVVEGGRSYAIEACVVDGKVYKPGEPLPPIEHESGQ